MKGTFNQGWWNCFESFAAEVFAVDMYADDVCTRVLDGAGITKKEAGYWIDHECNNNPRVVEVVRNYWLKFAGKD